MEEQSIQIAVASLNPVKLEAARLGFAQAFPDFLFEIEGVAVLTDIPAQPLGDRQTYQGAITRLQALMVQQPDADFWVGIEGGVQRNVTGVYDSFAWIVVQQENHLYSSRTSTFPLPPKVCRYLDEGMELGDADDLVFGTSMSKQQNGAVGLLTQDQITRTDLLAQSVFLSLIPFKSRELYTDK
jgi:inosine/xanthosine triphosphatase